MRMIMNIFFGATSDHRKIWFWCRIWIDRERHLDSNPVVRFEMVGKDFGNNSDGRGMSAVLRGHGENFSMEEFQAFVGWENTGFGHSKVFEPGEASNGGNGGRHGQVLDMILV